MKTLIIFPLILSLFVGVFPAPATAGAAERKLPYYLEENKSRYETYQTANPDMPFDIVVAYVNSGVDKAYYSDIEIVKNPFDVRILVNKNIALPSGYAPNDLVTLPGGMLRAEAAAAFTEMRAAAADAGLSLVIRSSYRSHWDQVASYDLVMGNYGREAAEISVARPGHSEHQLGLALDIVDREGTSGPLTVLGFDESREYFWLLEHGFEYGFILRYPRGYTDIQGFVYEPWHWRYVGVKIASIMHYRGITTFEEYYGKYLAPAVLNKIQQRRVPRPSLHMAER